MASRKTWLATGIVLIAAILLLYPSIRSAVKFRDYPEHIQFAAAMQDGSIPVLTHPLFHFMLIAVKRLSSLPWENAAIAVALVMQAALALSIFGMIAYRLPRGNPALVIGVVLTLMLLMVSAITFFTWESQNLYFGYLIPHVYHNPTMLVLKPLSLLSFVYAVGIFSDAKHFKTRAAWVISAVLVLLSALAKPSYIIAIIPALGLFGLYRLARRGVTQKALNWRLGILGFALPAGLILIAQFALLPNSGSGADMIGLMPFGFIQQRGDMNMWLLQLVMSLAFPACVYALYFDRARHSISLNLAWLAAGFALIYYYLLVETNRVNVGNFTWSAQIMVLILFVVSVQFLVGQVFPDRKMTLNWRVGVCFSVLLLHFICGVVWYAVNLLPQYAEPFF